MAHNTKTVTTLTALSVWLMIVVIFGSCLYECHGFAPLSHSSCRHKAILHFMSSSNNSNDDAATVAAHQSTDRDEAILALLAKARELGPVGSRLSEQEQQDLLQEARAVAMQFSDDSQAAAPAAATVPLTGIHDMVYSAAPGGSSGKIGPFNGKVQQEFVDETTFINSVELGPLRIALTATREILQDQKRIRVRFQETTISLFGNVVKTQAMGANQGGVWKCLFAGNVVDRTTGQTKLVRIMETPSLFIIEQNL